jgi:hypothetical protein
MAVRVEDTTESLPKFEFARGQEVVYVNEEKRVAVWRAPYCGPTWLHVPTFDATAEELAALEEQVAARVPPNATLTVLTRAGLRGMFAAVEHSSPLIGE